jgi:hypothetical protein
LFCSEQHCNPSKPKLSLFADKGKPEARRIPMTDERKASINMSGVRTMSDDELHAVTGGSMMAIVTRAFEDYLKNCLFKLTREGTVAVCPLPK